MSTETAALRMGVTSYDEAQAIEHCCIKFGIQPTIVQAHFLGQLHVESAGFTALRENLNYSVQGLLATFGRHRISEADARRLGRAPGRPADQEAIANCIYGGPWGRANLGNTQPGDGWRFRGGGRKQLTGRANYTAFSREVYGDDRLVDHPNLITMLPYSIECGGWYWRQRNLNFWAARDDVLAVSRGVNLGDPRHRGTPNGLEARREQTRRALRIYQEMRQ